ncbi:cutinase-2 [Diaporthe amygdali]|uniref:cutinase-2 n=1 Tax=Phomopsis amygdali TaxID=1214568 RepID=UPI0022FE8259|nr:cutinase-2 [Diaporthe amygdali]KAJ0122021.1 cutinase-2 [Diaporthe amygdali]
MKSSILNVLVGLTAVAAVPSDYASLDTRQGGVVSNDLKNGDCKPVTFIMARGSTETSNMGTVVGPQTCAAIKQNLGADQVACQGIGTEDGYAAALPPNFQAKNTDDQSINAALKIVNLATTQCPDTTIVMGGYSQGSAVVDNAIQQMPAATQAKVAGVVVWGFTRAEQDNLQIPGYPQAQTKVFCATGDLVCNNTLTITAAHLSYGRNADESGAFLAQMAKAAPAAGGAAAGAAAGGAAGAAAGGAAAGAAGAAAGGAAGAATGAATGAAKGGKKKTGGLTSLFGN